MKKISKLILVFLVFSISTPSVAKEVFALIELKSKSSVYRVYTDNESRYPKGYFFDCGKTVYFKIDKLKNFRLYTKKNWSKFTKVSSPLIRQTFDGSAEIAKFGLTGKLPNDSRNQFVKGGLLKPIYRPKDCYCSVGPGVLLDAGKIREFDNKTNDVIFPSRSWYEIPNGSWYQTWFTKKCKNKLGETHLIYYDRLEKRLCPIEEQFWRGEHPGRAFKKEIGSLSEFRLLRAKTSGTLEALSSETSLEEVWKQREQFNLLLDLPNSINKVFTAHVYNWLGSGKGKLNNSNNIIISKKIKSAEPENRELHLIRKNGKNYDLMEIGSDNFNDWLKLLKKSDYKAKLKANIIRIKKVNSDEFNVYIYCASVSTIFKFKLIENNVIELKTFIVNHSIDDFCVDNDENIYYSSLEVNRPLEFEMTIFSDDSLKQMPKFISEEEIRNQMNLHKKLKNISGKIVFSRTFYENVYQLEPFSRKTKVLYKINLNKKYFKQGFKVKEVSSEVFNLAGDQLLALLKKNSASINPISEKLPEFPDSYQKPNKVLLAIYEEN